jgi:hypothetical protein
MMVAEGVKATSMPDLQAKGFDQRNVSDGASAPSLHHGGRNTRGQIPSGEEISALEVLTATRGSTESLINARWGLRTRTVRHLPL